MKPFRPLVPLCVGLFASAVGAAPILRMDVQPTFSGIGGDRGPKTVFLENDGPDVAGVVTIQGDESNPSYPVELPRGARKRLLTLPHSDYSSLQYSLSTPRGNLVQNVPSAGYQDAAGGTAVLIGDDEGGIAFLREPRTEGKRNLAALDAYAKPEIAPGRSSAYLPYRAVFLGPGSERIDDAAVDALREYAMGGGTLVFLGGASSPTLEDPRWANVLPGAGWRPRTILASVALAEAGGKALPGPFTILEPTRMLAGAVTERGKGNEPLFQLSRGLGLGRVVVLEYSPLDAPLGAWAGRGRAILPLLRNGEGARGRVLRDDYLLNGLSEASNSFGGFSSPPGAFRSVGGNDPFSTRLPGTGTVFGILGLYFVLVVPVSFLVLRRMKRGELAWVTAPLLSLGFAAALFRSAEGLYAAALSTATQGVVVLQEGVPEGTFYGTSRMFFPRGGTYDLRLDGVESLRAASNEYGYGSDRLAGFNVVDAGSIEVPRLEATNLAFREMSLVQRVPDAGWFVITPVDLSRVRVENRSPYAFSGWLATGSGQSAPFELPPGGAKVVTRGPRVPNDAQLPVTDIRNLTRRSGRMALSGRIDGYRPGPQLGTEVAGQSGVQVLAFAEERAR